MTVDERLEDSDRDSFGFQLIDLPTEESGQPSRIFAIESSVIAECGLHTEAEYFATTGEGKDSTACDDWYFLPISTSVVISDQPQPESAETAAEDDGRIPKLWENVAEDKHTAFYDPLSTSEDVCLPPDIVMVPEVAYELSSQFSGERYRDEIDVDTSFSLPAASADIPSAIISDTSSLHTVETGEPSMQLRVVETAILSPVKGITSSPLIPSSSMFLAAVEELQSPDQVLSLSVCEPVYAHPDVIYLEPSTVAQRPIVVEREQTQSGDSEEQRVPFSPQFPAQSTAEEIRQPDGTVVRRRVVRTRVRRVATRRVRRRQPDGRVVEYTETVELPEEAGGESDDQLSEVVAAASGVSGSGGAAAQVVGVHTDTEQPGEPQMDTEVEVVRETLPDGRVVERRIVRTRQRRTIVKRVVVRPDRSGDGCV